MKRMIKFFMIIVFVFSFLISGKTQKLMIINKDTVVVISPDQLGIINSLIEDREHVILKLDTAINIIHNDSLIMMRKDSVLYNQSIIIEKYIKNHKTTVESYEIKLDKEEQKSKWLIFSSSTAIIILGILAIL